MRQSEREKRGDPLKFSAGIRRSSCGNWQRLRAPASKSHVRNRTSINMDVFRADPDRARSWGSIYVSRPFAPSQLDGETDRSPADFQLDQPSGL